METLSAQLEHEVAFAERRLWAHPSARRVLDGSANAATLASYYVSACEIVRHAPALLAQSHEQLRRSGADSALVGLFAQKVAEEQGHDQWLIEDLEAIGYPRARAAQLPVAEAAAAYVSFHERVIPIYGEAFLGTAFVLESLSVRCAGTTAANLRARSNIVGIAAGSNAGLSFFVRHHAADVGHTAQLAQVIDRFVIDHSAQQYLLLCARFTATLYADLFGAAPRRASGAQLS